MDHLGAKIAIAVALLACYWGRRRRLAALAKSGKFEEITAKYPELQGKIVLPAK